MLHNAWLFIEVTWILIRRAISVQRMQWTTWNVMLHNAWLFIEITWILIRHAISGECNEPHEMWWCTCMGMHGSSSSSSCKSQFGMRSRSGECDEPDEMWWCKMHVHHHDEHACIHTWWMIIHPLSFNPSILYPSFHPSFIIHHPYWKTKEIKNYSTEYSHVVPHHSTDSAINCLTAQIGRDAVGLVVYGRNSKD